MVCERDDAPLYIGAKRREFNLTVISVLTITDRHWFRTPGRSLFNNSNTGIGRRRLQIFALFGIGG